MDVLAQLEDLKSVAQKCSIKIELCNLKHEELSIQSGLCKVNGSNLIILDKKLEPEEQVQVILKALENFDLESFYVPSWIREHLEKTSSTCKDQ